MEKRKKATFESSLNELKKGKVSNMKNYKKYIAVAALFVAMFIGTFIGGSSTKASAAIRKCYTISTSNTRVYSNTALTRGYGWIYPTDVVTVYTVTDRYCYVGYPAGNRIKKGYIATRAILLATRGNTYKNNVGSFDTYRRPGAGKFGTSTKGDTVTVLGTSGNYTQIKYNVSNYYKYAFALTSDVNRYVLGNVPSVSGGSTSITASQAKNVMFNAVYYANMYPDLKVAFGYDSNKLYNHYVTCGIKEGRSASPVFDPIYYIDNNSDLKKAFGNNYVAAYNHWISNGCSEGRASSRFYNGFYYRNKYSDLNRAYFSSGVSGETYYNLAYHYLKYGIGERRLANGNGYIPSGLGESTTVSSSNTSVAQKIVDYELSQVGIGDYKGNNNVKYNTWYYGRTVSGSGHAWCMAFQAYCCNQITGSNNAVPKTASCTSAVNEFKKRGQFYYSKYYGGNYTPKAGDIVYYTNGSRYSSCHVGMIISAPVNGYLQTVEGNIQCSDGNWKIVKFTKNAKRTVNSSYVLGYAAPNY